MTEQHVHFGAGIRHEAGSFLVGAGIGRALVLSTPEQSEIAEGLSRELGVLSVGVFPGAAMHTPVEVTEQALAVATARGADGLVSIGGGSTIGLGKAMSLRTGLSHVAIPTTYAGSEATPILGQTQNGLKTTLRNPAVRPRVVLYDPELTVSLPPALTVTSALNAIAHAAEALYAPDRTDLTTEKAIAGMGAFATSLPRLRTAPGDLAAREAAQRGAYACGYVLGRTEMSLHHKLCHTLGGSFGLPHAQTHAVILPHAIHHNAAAAPDLLAPVSAIFGGAGAAGGPGRVLWSYAASLGAPMSLRDLGLPQEAVARAAEIAVQNPYRNPAPVTEDGLRALLSNAWSGTPPGTPASHETP